MPAPPPARCSCESTRPYPPALCAALLAPLALQGAEGRILVQLAPWLREFKPTILLSMHAFLYLDDTALHAAMKPVLYSYKTLLLATNGDVIDRALFSVPGWCRLCTLILTDEELPAGAASWKEALGFT